MNNLFFINQAMHRYFRDQIANLSDYILSSLNHEGSSTFVETLAIHFPTVDFTALTSLIKKKGENTRELLAAAVNGNEIKKLQAQVSNDSHAICQELSSFLKNDVSHLVQLMNNITSILVDWALAVKNKSWPRAVALMDQYRKIAGELVDDLTRLVQESIMKK